MHIFGQAVFEKLDQSYTFINCSPFLHGYMTLHSTVFLFLGPSIVFTHQPHDLGRYAYGKQIGIY